ncbi:MAG: regulatory protein RecX, partial [Oscillospiraceae bacterium]|nr:regulatory protein RecX [Oscillospiraceae bacterium]
MKIEKIERSKHQQERILVHLEGGDLLRITEDELLHFGLYTGLDIDDATVVELQKCSARSQTKARAANMISARPLSRRELEKRLRDKGA